MSSQLITNKITQNTIFVTWKITSCSANDSSMRSPVFTIISDGSPISFMMSINRRVILTLGIEQTTGQAGRAVVYLAVTNDRDINTMKVYFSENWVIARSFNDIGCLPEYVSPCWKTTNLKINCKITWFGFVETVTIPKRPISPLSIANVPFDNTVIPDFTIIVGGKELLAHKAILARNSPVLLAMFESPMTESKENKIIIEDIEFSTMELLLRIVYTGESEALNDVDTALAVLEAAEKYQMSMLKVLCECKLQLRIKADNVLMLLEEADKYNALQLCETCVTYILAIKDEKISCEFEKIQHKPNIAIAFVNALAYQLSSTAIQK